ncbi:hypothetical protein A3E45_00430 [Candidatus Daviesbacteria bacterium RIFCSPHIGHO2_12_FULL_43_11]|uniref:Uncharacterized protein n=1 Tax=Candidatus Daviesbacteria bacterium RIFCSPHIGHO2_12_FULL_43_11 TaxID=1797780 RepID=A0A1F5K4Q2_9BACT|nr:MAG: hypothetical protein A2874_00745 [Candidatus Daviesbacteria bacterium RIFCSPHIGHO2_01_FULL_43_17]OGE35748.1 MAG: hypothetical protein A3E45_00430 [Candidatus Daviesbacteria bacterium RIFCSPHIGHO2_12_FULL_43_11]OGE69661.1 MAG: hypothetical protein A3J21_03130 [Candidatus Daviesbacteria bacterium RIFCSPLOWO2_02_FULL_43_11]
MFVSLVPGGAIVLRVLESGRQVFHRVGPRSQKCRHRRQAQHIKSYFQRTDTARSRKTSAEGLKEPAKV